LAHEQSQDHAKRLMSIKISSLFIILYFFLYSINLLGHSFKLFGSGFAEKLLSTTANPFLGLFLGIVSTSVIQSSSTTTSIIVGLVAAGGLSLQNAIPMVMGANIGTTVTNALVSFGHATRRAEFSRAFSAAIVHDLFNTMSVIVLFPVELKFRIIEKTAGLMEKYFVGVGGMKLFNPIKFIISPAIKATDYIIGAIPYAPVIMLVLALLILFASLALLVKTIRAMVMGKVERIIDRYLFGRDSISFLLGLTLTAIVQSSSVTTSLLVPLAGAGILTVRQVYPYTLGANIGTTVTAIIAALATGNTVAVTVAFSHLFFNIYGIAIFYPLRVLPISVAMRIGRFSGKSQKHVYIVIATFLTIYIVPLLLFVL
jgi:sodium-dependent phosphate cotransporter